MTQRYQRSFIIRNAAASISLSRSLSLSPSLSLSILTSIKMLDFRKFTKETTFLPQECHSVMKKIHSIMKKIHFWEKSGGLCSTHAVSIK